MRLIDADALESKMIKEKDAVVSRDKYGIGYSNGMSMAHAMSVMSPTVDAVPVDDVARMLSDLFGDGCPCNYNDIDEWLAGSDGCTEKCNKNEDPLLCWKLLVKRYGERRSE